jgi:hypothetical protein
MYVAGPATSATPCTGLEADLLHYVQSSPEYQSLRHRIANPLALAANETWVEEEIAYFLYDLVADQPGLLAPPLALFAVDRMRKELLLVRLIVPNADLTEVIVSEMIPSLPLPQQGD